jgi:hypothetical protein
MWVKLKYVVDFFFSLHAAELHPEAQPRFRFEESLLLSCTCLGLTKLSPKPMTICQNMKY